MKHYQSLLITTFLFFSHSIFFAHTIPVDNHEATLVVVLMVKDEAEVIIPTLQPFLDGGIDSYLIYDTGSTDGTPDIVRTFFKKNNVTHGYVIEESFVDFATSRNRGLDLAEHIFPHAYFMVMSDAEWYIHDAHALLHFCEINKYNDSNLGGAYLIRLFTTKDAMEHYTSRLIRSKKGVRFVGVVHEVVNQQAVGVVPPNVYFEYTPELRGIDKSQKRWKQDCVLLHRHLDKHPDDPRTLFYLGQTYQFLGDWKNAIICYIKRSALDNGFPEEQYMAAYRVGCAIEHCIETEVIDTTYTWDDALWWYLKAYSMRPYRAEPLIRIAWHYLINNEKEIAYLFASRAVELPFPERDGLFVEKRAYDYLRYDILGQCAFNVGEYEKGKNATLKALRVDPHLMHLHHNLGLYLQHITL